MILNLTDPQLANHEWNERHNEGRILEFTLKELIDRTHPDLITVCGDIAWAGEMYSYERFSTLVDSYGIPWAPILGNHDNQRGYGHSCEVADIFAAQKHCIFEKGPRELGCGNYVIRIMECERPVTALIMMDSHDSRPPLPHEGNVDEVWDEVYPEQIEWYREEIKKLKAEGYHDSAILLHIPIYAYRDAYKAAAKDNFRYRDHSPEECVGSDFWNEGYEDSFGANYEGIGSHPYDNGFFDDIKKLDHTRHILCGHDHISNASIRYRGVRFTFITKLGAGCYFDPRMNGGTVMTVGNDGINSLYHEYVSVEGI